MRARAGRVDHALAVGVILLAVAGCGADPATDDRPSAAAVPMLTDPQLQRVLLPHRTMGASYDVVTPSTAASPSLGCVDLLAPARVGAGVGGSRATARVDYGRAGAESTELVTVVVLSLASDRAAFEAFDAFSESAAECTEVSTDSDGSQTSLAVTSRRVPVEEPVAQEVLVLADGTRSDGVLSPAFGVSVKLGRVANHLIAVETAGLGVDAPDLTPYYNVLRARLLTVLDGRDPGPGKRVSA